MRGSVRFRRVVALALPLVVGTTGLAAVAAVSGLGAAPASAALDQFQCYSATAVASSVAPVPFKSTPAKVKLKNNFATGGFIVSPGAVQMHCYPVQTTVTTGGHPVTTPVKNAAADLLCKTISSTTVKLPASIMLTNQFGTGALKPISVRSLCMPSWNSRTTPPAFPAAKAPANLDAYVCYNVVHPGGTPSFQGPTTATMKDQLGTVSIGVGAPNVLCLPASETASVTGVAPKILNSAQYSVCFAIPPAKSVAPRTVYDKNQFGVGAVKVGRDTQLCVPSVKYVAPPSTTTTANTGTTDSTTTTSTTILVGHATVTSYSDPNISGPYDIEAGSDGALWFSNYETTVAHPYGSIGRITTAGTITTYGDWTISRPDGLAKGADGAMWFANTGNNTIGRIAPDGTVTNTADSRISLPYRVAPGPGGAMWFTNSTANSVGSIIGGVVNTYTTTGIYYPQGIAAGSDGNMWFVNFYGGSIGRVDTDGNITIYADYRVSYPVSITSGPDGALWFTNYGNASIGRITTDGTITSYTNSSIANPTDIVASGGALWFTNEGNNSIGRITIDGTITNFTDPSITFPDGIAAGPDAAIWFTNTGNNTIGRLVPSS
jgi:virginiamycin B lyase